MGKKRCFLITICLLSGTLVMSGCVERKLTIVTEPAEAAVWLNDEEIGPAPVTVNFNWYGDYNVRIEKPGYEIVNTHRMLKPPAHDRFPLDFFAEVLWPGTIKDAYTWTFDLQPYRTSTPEELVESADIMRQRADQELGKIAIEILEDK